MAGRKDGFDLGMFLTRLGLTLVLVLATYNPTRYSYVNWIRESMAGEGLEAAHFLVGVVLLIGWVVLVSATLNAMGGLGLALGVALLGTLVWFLVDIGVLSGSGMSFYTWIALVALAILLAIGMCWAHIWRSLTGQVAVDDLDN
jgi:hypothetical protein